MPKPLDYDPLVDAFINAKRAKNPTARTHLTYRTALSELGDWLATLPAEALITRPAKGKKKAIVVVPAAVDETGDIGVDHLRCFIAYLQNRDQLAGGRNHSVDRSGRKLSPNTVSNRWRAISSFIGWLMKEGEFPEGYDPRVNIESPSLVDNPVEVLELDQIRALVGTCGKGKHGRSFEDFRDEAILRVFFEAGPRRGEVAHARLDWLNLAQRRLRVDGLYVKTMEGKDVPLSDRTVLALTRYLGQRAKHKHAGRPELWLATKGALSPGGLYQMIKTRGVAIGVNLHPHQLRHSWANLYLDQGGRERDLKRLGGWNSDKQPRRYSRANEAKRAIAAHGELAIGDLI